MSGRAVEGPVQSATLSFIGLDHSWREKRIGVYAQGSGRYVGEIAYYPDDGRFAFSPLGSAPIPYEALVDIAALIKWHNDEYVQRPKP